MQLCFARFGIPWDDAQFLSLHGRPLHLIERKLQAEKLFLFTDRVNSPAAVARFLIDRFGEQEVGRYHLSVGECLATSRERLLAGDPQTIAGQVFHEPNCLILRNTAPIAGAIKPRFGLREQELAHSRGLITKNEVRAAVLHTLALPQQGVLWDIGAGSGSIGIESARLFPELTVYSVEKDEAQCANLHANRERFGCWNLSVVPGTAPPVLARLPLPDRVFIGGSGGDLSSILKGLFNTIAASTIIVLTAVSDRTRSQAPRLLLDGGYRVTVSRVSVSRFVGVDGKETRLNPIDIIRAERDDD
jgi:precorrin-6Y C5,15-methyltransferase (decarboxylating)